MLNSYKLQATSHKLQAASYKPQATSFKPQAASNVVWLIPRVEDFHQSVVGATCGHTFMKLHYIAMGTARRAPAWGLWLAACGRSK
jgi:hypothetical protein